jgi:SPP1 gp7 family putative phage head morphogenesis protein
MADTPIPPGFKLGTVEPKNAVEAFTQRDLLQPTFNWWDVWQQEHANAFMVSGIHEQSLLKLVRDEVGETMRTGKSFNDFVKALKPKLVEQGYWGDVLITDPRTGEQRISRFDENRLRLILDTNLRQSNAAGRWQAAQRSKARRPYLMYRTMRDERVRISHQAWEGVVLPVDHPWWDTHYPPNGWRCRCRAISLSERDVERYRRDGFKIITDPPQSGMVRYLDKRTGLEAEVPAGIDPGFAYNAGKARGAELGKLARQAEVPPLATPAAAPPAPAPRVFQPQPTGKDAARWAVENGLADRADYTGIKAEVANAFNRSLFDHLQEFPELRKNQKFVGTGQAQFAAWRDDAVDKRVERLRPLYPGADEQTLRENAERGVKKLRMKPGTWAHSWAQPDFSGIAVNRKFGADVDTFKLQLARNVETGYHPPGGDTIRSVVDHELGHQLDNLLGLSKDAEIQQLYLDALKAGIKTQLSAYAGKNRQEFIAEAWSEALNNPQPRAVATRIAEIIRARYAAKFPPSRP